MGVPHIFEKGSKVLLHGDGPYTVATATRDPAGQLVYNLTEMPGYLWPADEVTAYEGPPGPSSADIPPIPTEDTPERLELIDDIVKALRTEIRTQAADANAEQAILEVLDIEALARVSMDAIMKRIMADLAALNAMATKINETVGDSP